MNLSNAGSKALQRLNQGGKETLIMEKTRLQQIWSARIPIAIALTLILSTVIVRFSFGRGWALVAAIVSPVVWLVLRPWRLAPLSDDAADRLRISCTIALCLPILWIGQAYWFWGR